MVENLEFFEAIIKKIKYQPHLVMTYALNVPFAHIKFNFKNDEEQRYFRTNFKGKEVIEMDCFEIQSIPKIWLFELRIPIFWEKISILINDTEQDRKIAVIGYQKQMLAFSTNGYYREWNIADPEFDPDELIKRIEMALPPSR